MVCLRKALAEDGYTCQVGNMVASIQTWEVDYKEVGYTRDELNALICKAGYPIYTVGCTNAHGESIQELQDLFSLSRIISGDSFYLKDVQDTVDIASSVTGWNDSLRMEIKLPTEACDGSEKTLRAAAENGNEYVVRLTMPFAVLESAPEQVPSC